MHHRASPEFYQVTRMRYRWRSLPRILQHRASSSQGISTNGSFLFRSNHLMDTLPSRPFLGRRRHDLKLWTFLLFLGALLLLLLLLLLQIAFQGHQWGSTEKRKTWITPWFRETTSVGRQGDQEGRRYSTMEGDEIIPNNRTFLREEGHTEGFTLRLGGEPKSGTTWLGRVIIQLSLLLCGNEQNPWCEVGALTREDRGADYQYAFELLYAGNKTVFLHFTDLEFQKHRIPFFGRGGDCARGCRPRNNGFAIAPPCESVTLGNMTRNRLLECLPEQSARCTGIMVKLMGPIDPRFQRHVVIFRDPRDVVISEHRMKMSMPDWYHLPQMELDDFIRLRFELTVAWVHQRWEWHTSALSAVTHIIHYKQIKADYRLWVDLAAFMGLKCSPELALKAWEGRRSSSLHRNYQSYGLSFETLEWMNNTMASLLPKLLLDQYGLTIQR